MHNGQLGHMQPAGAIYLVSPVIPSRSLSILALPPLVPETSPPKMPAVKQNKMQGEKPNWMAASQIAFLQRKVPHKPAEAAVEDT